MASAAIVITTINIRKKNIAMIVLQVDLHPNLDE